MPFTKIVPADLQGKGVIGQPAVPGLSVSEMQESVEQIVREVAIPAVNRLIDELEATSASGNIGMSVPSGMAPETPETVQGVVQSHVENSENPHGVTASQVGAYTKSETDQAIDEKVQAIGAADMSKAEFATNGEYGVVDKAKAAETAESATESDDGVKVYTHSKSGTVHEFTGSGANGRALLTADVEAGDTFTVNGSPADAYLGPDPAADAMAGSEWNGKWVSFVFDGTTINFKGGGGLSAADKAKLIPGNLRDGVTIAGITGSLKILACGGASTSGYHVGWDGAKYAVGDFAYSRPSFTFVGTPVMVVAYMPSNSTSTITICGKAISGAAEAQVITEGLIGNEIKADPYNADFYVTFAVLGYT